MIIALEFCPLCLLIVISVANYNILGVHFTCFGINEPFVFLVGLPLRGD